MKSSEKLFINNLVIVLKNKIIRDKSYFAQVFQENLPYKPLFIKLKLTWNCNLRCQMCNHWRERVSDMPVDFFKKVVTELSELGCKRIHLSGGEPLLYPQIFELMEHIRKKNMKLTMTTNGTLINEKNAPKIADLVSNINISLDSPFSHLHDQVRGIKNAFHRTLRGIELLKKYHQAKLQINMVVNPLNYASVTELPDLAYNLGAHNICLIPVKIRTQEISYFRLEQLLEYNEKIAPFAYAKSLMYNLIENYKQIYVFGQTLEELQESCKGNYAQGYYDTHPCMALWTHALIDHEGRVSACCYAVNNPILGDLKVQSFYEIWTSERYQNLRNTYHAPLQDCKGCTMFIHKNEEILKKLKS
ncbi:MAG: radical SAM/SPASM domain-containing protein [Bacteroidia bacterium]|nr:MAG: radical SAM/SPASM domain-containing protein [Bacteroidia bacterium]